MRVFDLYCEKWIVYFENAGKVNTEKTLELAEKRAQELGINTIVLASTNGYTAQKAIEIYDEADVRFIVVGTDRESFSEGLLQRLKDKEVPVIFTSDFEYTYPEPVRNAFKKLSEGVKVCMEICMVAVTKGSIPEGVEVIAIAGTSSRGFEGGGGADTALVILPRPNLELNKLSEKAKRRDVKEIICKPR